MRKRITGIPVGHQIPFILVNTTGKTPHYRIIENIHDILPYLLGHTLGSKAKRFHKKRPGPVMLLIISPGEFLVKVSVKTEEVFLCRGLLVGMNMIRHNGECPGDNSIFPGKMIIEGNVEYTVLNRVKDNISANPLAVHVVCTFFLVFPVFLTHLPTAQ